MASNAIDTSMADTEQAIRSWFDSEVTPLLYSLTGLDLLIDTAAGTITDQADREFYDDGLRNAQRLVLSTGTATGSLLITDVTHGVITGTMDAGMLAIAQAGDTTGWTISSAYEKAWQGVTYNEREGVPYFTVAWLPGTAIEMELGNPAGNLYREPGIIQVTVMAEDGGGTQPALLAASEISGKMRNLYLNYRQSGSIRLRQPSVGKIETANGWASVVVSTPYRRDARPV